MSDGQQKRALDGHAVVTEDTAGHAPLIPAVTCDWQLLVIRLSNITKELENSYWKMNANNLSLSRFVSFQSYTT